jgi:hypothetical protein
MECPRCGAASNGAAECPRCGVVLAKARPSAERPRPAAPLEALPPTPAWRALALPAFGLLALAVGAFVYLSPTADSPPARPRRPPASRPVPADAGSASLDDTLPGALVASPEPTPAPTVDPRALGAEDAADARRLTAKLQTGAPIEDDDIRVAERLHEQAPEAAAPLLVGALRQAAFQRRDARDYARAAELLTRAMALAPEDPSLRRALLEARFAQSDWPAVESVANELLERSPHASDAVCALARALVHQDRAGEAADALKAFREEAERQRRGTDPCVDALYARVVKNQRVEARLQEHNLAHFHVRYDGAAHEDIGRAVLQVLERHYATLSLTFARQPSEPIPVVLLSQRSYYDVNGAPAWSGGQFDTFDGSVRVPIGGLTSSLSPDLDGVLLHELTHAFVATCSANLAPRVLQEGLAQYVEGHRVATDLGDQELRDLARGRIQGVGASYLQSLAFVEDLIAQRGQGGINDLLEAMSTTRDVDAAFRQVYGGSLRELQQAWAARFHQRYG